MLRLIADDNLRAGIRDALDRRVGEVDLIDLWSIGLARADDAMVLGVAAAHRRVLVADDAQSLARLALERVDSGLPMAGVILIALGAHRGDVIDELMLLIESYHQDELADQVIYLPLAPEPEPAACSERTKHLLQRGARTGRRSSPRRAKAARGR